MCTPVIVTVSIIVPPPKQTHHNVYVLALDALLMFILKYPHLGRRERRLRLHQTPPLTIAPTSMPNTKLFNARYSSDTRKHNTTVDLSTPIIDRTSCAVYLGTFKTDFVLLMVRCRVQTFFETNTVNIIQTSLMKTTAQCNRTTFIATIPNVRIAGIVHKTTYNQHLRL